MGDVGKEGVAGADRVWPATSDAEARRLAAGSPSTRPVDRHDLREAVRAANEVAVGVGRQQRHVADVGVEQLDAEQVARPAP